ncbi:hypothetical protein VOLCADRAFT_106262 [Volvox carteri f. nagariensis]|uniref:Uncharacterized protein n=1 Tax=Volvox carteri f. nagariensis TaxID=3068 RepID=D8U669_VOLCA|nr:uncharacterized protein VOLCADRAFT_106262 [Volvox carteri f. nagariensis]EFJ44888.1 hypothetical protein VOLCADRAFT_106262 [Volvox carteri f. nagariensis]|eukprot:XP_002954171.1 hypothetical protein VOLCADRAFT_106262 [Volvox carteri f. nagariensis]
MATRASLARGTAPKEVFEGRVHKWERRWLVHKKGTIKTEVMLELLRWIVTDERCPELTGPRHPHIKPLKRPIIKQPSKKPAEQAGEQAGEQQGAGQPAEQDAEQGGEPATAAATEAPKQAAAIDTDKNPQEQPAGAAGGQTAIAFGGVLQQPQQPQEGVAGSRAAFADNSAPQGAGVAILTPQQEPNSAADAGLDPLVTGAAEPTKVFHVAFQSIGDPTEGVPPGRDGPPAPGDGQPAAAQDIEMADAVGPP